MLVHRREGGAYRERQGRRRLAADHDRSGGGGPSIHATLDHALIVDFVNAGRPVSERVALELSVESARGLITAMQTALDAFGQGA